MSGLLTHVAIIRMEELEQELRPSARIKAEIKIFDVDIFDK
jgi:hypothetical protein